jgi:hypothetical protein
LNRANNPNNPQTPTRREGKIRSPLTAGLLRLTKPGIGPIGKTVSILFLANKFPWASGK